MINWRKLAKKIPISIRTSRGETFQIVFVKDFADGKTLGHTTFQPNQIAILMGQSDKMTVITYLHEVLHAFADTYGAGITESQVLVLEKTIEYVLKKGNIFKETE